jgi:hypothetical protein
MKGAGYLRLLCQKQLDDEMVSVEDSTPNFATTYP